ncbi:MAG: DUF4124 domain-containing protein [Thermodesulfobacteriota bacterium]
MKILLKVCCGVLVFFLATEFRLQAGFYSWTDENGVKRYSDTAPDETAADVKVHAEIPSDGQEATVSSPNGNQPTPADWKDGDVYQELEREKALKKQKAEEEKAQAARAEWEGKIQAEKDRLQGEIDRIRQLAVGPSLSIALKNARIKEFQDRLDILEKSPEDYFGKKEP